MLLQILDDGILTDSHGKKVDFKNTVIIMTSNIGAKEITAKHATFGFADAAGEFEQTQEQIKNKVMGALKSSFRPEFLNRIDDIIVFKQLTEENIRAIASLMLDTVAKRLQENMGIILNFTDAAVAHLAKAGYDPIYGARPLKRTIVSEVEDKIAEKFLDGSLKDKESITVDVADDKIIFA
jgi:ATP-dependent Clp protease ATP-binding subunit ClpC